MKKKEWKAYAKAIEQECEEYAQRVVYAESELVDVKGELEIKEIQRRLAMYHQADVDTRNSQQKELIKKIIAWSRKPALDSEKFAVAQEEVRNIMDDHEAIINQHSKLPKTWMDTWMESEYPELETITHHDIALESDFEAEHDR